jgi:hypothetical protein
MSALTYVQGRSLTQRLQLAGAEPKEGIPLWGDTGVDLVPQAARF